MQPDGKVARLCNQPHRPTQGRQGSDWDSRARVGRNEGCLHGNLSPLTPITNLSSYTYGDGQMIGPQSDVQRSLGGCHTLVSPVFKEGESAVAEISL